LGITIPPHTIRRFWTMLAHLHGQTWNGAKVARNFGVAESTVRRYLDILMGSFVIRLVQPWFENIGKRQVKAPKIYFTDSGLLHSLLNLRSLDDLEAHPSVGASWEGFALLEVLSALRVEPEEAFFWRTHAGAELALLITRGARRVGFEIKRTLRPRLTPSMRHALEDLRLERLFVVYPGEVAYPMSDRVETLPAEKIWTHLPTYWDTNLEVVGEQWK